MSQLMNNVINFTARELGLNDEKVKSILVNEINDMKSTPRYVGDTYKKVVNNLSKLDTEKSVNPSDYKDFIFNNFNDC